MSFASTTSFKSPLVEVSDLNVRFRADAYQVRTLRDLFVRALTHPQRFFSPGKSFLALNRLNLTMERGDRVGLLGRNGSGKTTLCRVLVGRSGRQPGVRVDGTARGVFGSQYALYPDLSGWENARILCALLYPELSVAALKRAVASAIAFSELGDAIYRPVKSYSYGMHVRLMMSVSTAIPADLLILDEAFYGTDSSFSRKLFDRILELVHAARGVVLVSHSLEHVRRLCNRVVVLDAGVKVFDGSVEDGIHYYQSNSAEALALDSYSQAFAW